MQLFFILKYLCIIDTNIVIYLTKSRIKMF